MTIVVNNKLNSDIIVLKKEMFRMTFLCFRGLVKVTATGEAEP
jgi:hypothetical protein